MKLLIAILAAAIISVGITLAVEHRKLSGGGAANRETTVPSPKPSQAWLDLKKQSSKLDAELRETTKVDAKNSTEASRTLRAYSDYCNGEMDLFVKEEAVYRNEHDSEDSPVLIEQKEGTAAWCNAAKVLSSFMADPKNGYKVDGDEISTNDVPTYNRLLLAFRVASVRLVNANAAEASEEEH